jgi:hypothetical protein
MKMHVESPKNDTTSKNLSVLYDMEFLLGLPCLLPLFECVHKLIKIAKGQDVFVCDLVLYAILWRLSSWPNLNCISCVVIVSPSLRMLPLMISMQLET